ncbi:MAG: hypothetical protein E6I52_00560 [Chloroflexi bacterium]|nr:MAG: hypothetical protein E6I52_00560 [Chloroflexota bacterium]
MRYGIRTELAGVTQQQYDGMHEVFGPLAGQAPGFIAHIAGPTEGGWYMTEVWESKADYDRFMQEHVFPKLPPDAPRPKIQEFEVYSRQIKGQLHA